jgi:hypothetical protein
MQRCASSKTIILAIVTLAACFKPPEDILVDGPTLRIEIASASERDVTGNELAVRAPLAGDASTAHAEFLAANAGTIDPEHPVGIQGARVSLRRGTGVVDLADAFGGLMVFIEPAGSPTARVFLASAVAPTKDTVELELIANKTVYEGAQAVLTATTFSVGVSGPTPFGMDTPFELGLLIEIDLAIFDAVRRQGGH